MLATFLPPDTGVDGWTMLEGVLRPHAWILLVAMGVSLLATPVFRRIALRWRIYDMPDDRIKIHARPIPYLGGVAIFVGWLVPVLWIAIDNLASPESVPAETVEVIKQTATGVVPAHPWVEQPARLLWIAGAGLLVMLLGLVDDLVEIAPKTKLAGQVIAALLLAVGGVVFMAFPDLRLGNEQVFPIEATWVFVLGVAFQVVLVVGACNATNLLDGLDGLCSGVTAIISVGFLLLATSLLAWDLYRDGQHYANAEIIVVMSMALLGGVLGFLPYNFNPASIFMGDAGSMFLGFLAAVFMILFAEQPHSFKWFLGAMVIFGLPIFDTGLALVRRLVNHVPIFSGDRSHFYDQLVDRGLSVRASVLANYVLSVFFGAAGIGIMFIRLRYAVVVYLVLFAAIAVAAVAMGLVRIDRQNKDRTPAGKPGA